ncbi:MAG: ZIP family metal transporter [Pirellulales bacterium]|nr:ZIP family metal transporter [Pirellulales bacterium]
MSAYVPLACYSILVLLASLAGGWIPLVVRLTHQRMQLAISFVAGAMLGVGLLHMVPHALAELGSVDRVMLWALAGFVAMFFVERFFAFHHHDVPDDADTAAGHVHSHAHVHAHGHHHDHHHGHDHAVTVGHAAQATTSPHETGSAPPADHLLRQQRLNWGGAAVGLTLHSLADGVALAASVEAERELAGPVALAGLATFVVIFLHKPFDSMTIGTLMAVGGSSRRKRHVVNALFALAIPAGAALFYLGANSSGTGMQSVIGVALAFSAGTFLCISSSDLLPELQFHNHDRVKLSAALVLGLAVAWGVGFLEHAGHGHDGHGRSHGHQHVHDDGDHDH